MNPAQTRNRLPNVTPKTKPDGTSFLQFNWKGKQLYCTLGKGKQALRNAEIISERILGDMGLGLFSGEISDYLPSESPVKPRKSSEDTIPPKPELNPVQDAIEVLGAYIAVMEANGMSHSHITQYRCLVNNLKKDGLGWFARSKPRYLGLLKTAYKESEKEIPYSLPKPKKEKTQERNLADVVFSKEEITRILDWFEESKDYSHYLPFVKFRFLTGCRPCEAIALHWDDVDFENGTIVICRSHTPQDGLKGRKNRETTYLPMNESLRVLLTAQKGIDKDLIFPSPKGKYLNLRNFSQRAWKEMRKALGIEKEFYAIRHTVASHIVQSQGTAAAAYVLGHKSLEMVNRHYGKMLNQPTLPELV
jgi:integrase